MGAKVGEELLAEVTLVGGDLRVHSDLHELGGFPRHTPHLPSVNLKGGPKPFPAPSSGT
jgi:hypothetical protein